MEDVRVKVSAGGRVLIPARMRKALGIEEGDELFVSYDEDRLILTSRTAALRDAQTLAKKFRTDRSPADELIEERSREAARD